MRNYLHVENIAKKIVENFKEELDRVGILYRIFYRVKSAESLKKKISVKNYASNGNKLTDLLGIRITLYFKDDVQILHNHLKASNHLNHEALDSPSSDTFKPERLNLVFNFNEEDKNEILALLDDDKEIIDTTYELQIRTVLSEGWHEVEHDLRYKSQNDWVGHEDLLRNLNGLFATLDTSDFTMLKIFDTLSHRHYNRRNYSALLKSKFRLRFKTSTLDEKLLVILSESPELFKKLYRIEREEFLSTFLSSRISVPLTLDNLVYILNYLYIQDPTLYDNAGEFINEDIEAGLNRLKEA